VVEQRGQLIRGLKEAAQYFGKLIEVARHKGFTMEEDPTTLPSDNLRRWSGRFSKDRGSARDAAVDMAMMAHGYQSRLR